MSPLFRLLGVVLIVGLLGWGILESAGYGAGLFVNLPSLAMILGLLIGGLLVSFPPTQIGRAMAAAYRRHGEPDAAALAAHLAVLDRAYALAWAGGLTTKLVGIILMLKNLDDPSRIGPGLAAAAVPLLYGVILAEFFLAPLRHSLAARSPEAMAKLAPAGGRLNRAAAGFVIASVLLMVATFGATISADRICVAPDPALSAPATPAALVQPATRPTSP